MRKNPPGLPIPSTSTKEDDDEDIPHKIDGDIMSTESTSIHGDMNKAKRIEPDHEEKVMKPDGTKLPRVNSSRNIVPSTKPSKPHEIPSGSSTSQRYQQSRRLLNTFHEGDVALVMPLDLQLSALDHAIKSAVNACEELSEHRRREDWDEGPITYYDKIPETRLIHLSDMHPKLPRLRNPFEEKTSYEKEYEESLSRNNKMDEKKVEEEEVEEKDVLKRSQELLREVMETWMERGKELDMEEQKQEEKEKEKNNVLMELQDVPDPEVEREATIAAVEESTRWQALDNDLVTSIDAIRKEIGILEEYQLQLNRAGPPLRTIEHNHVFEDDDEEDTKPPPPPPPSTTKKLNRRKIMMDEPPPLPPPSSMKQKQDTKRNEITSNIPKTSAEIEIYRKHVKQVREIEEKIKYLESRLSIAVRTELFDECITIQSQINLLKTRRRRFNENYEKLLESAKRLNTNMKCAVQGEDYATARNLQDKLDSLVVLQSGITRGAEEPSSEESETLKCLEAELSAALLAEDFFACVQLQQRIKPLREKQLREAQKIELARNELEKLEAELSQAIEIEDFDRCELIQKRIDFLSS